MRVHSAKLSCKLALTDLFGTLRSEQLGARTSAAKLASHTAWRSLCLHT